MRRFLFALGLCLSSFATQAEEAASTPAPQYSVAEAMGDPQKRALLLEQLYQRLKTSPSDEDAKRVDAAISALMQKTGNAASDMFMEWGEQGLKSGNIAEALDYFDGALMLSPNAPEPYFKRATVLYAQGNVSAALADLQRAYLLEPRHTGALSGLGLIFSDLDHDKEALAAYEAALALNPRDADTDKLVRALRKKVLGEDI